MLAPRCRKLSSTGTSRPTSSDGSLCPQQRSHSKNATDELPPRHFVRTGPSETVTWPPSEEGLCGAGEDVSDEEVPNRVSSSSASSLGVVSPWWAWALSIQSRSLSGSLARSLWVWSVFGKAVRGRPAVCSPSEGDDPLVNRYRNRVGQAETKSCTLSHPGIDLRLEASPLFRRPPRLFHFLW